MKHAVKKATLSPAWERLIEWMQEINHGSIKGLKVRDREPVFNPLPTVVRLFLFGKNNGPNASRSNGDFFLKKEVVWLFEICDQERSFTIQELKIVNGLPVGITTEEMIRV